MICIKILLSRWSSVDHHAKVLFVVSEAGNKVIIFSKNQTIFFPQYDPIDTKNAVITTLLTSFWRKAAESVSLKVKKWKKTDNWKNDLHKDPIASVKAVLTTMRYFPCSLREGYKIYTFFEKTIFHFSSICSYGHEACSDYNLADEVPTKGRQKWFAQGEKTVKKHIFSKKMICIKILLSRSKQCWPPRQSSLRCLREWYKICTSLTKFIFFLSRFL